MTTRLLRVIVGSVALASAPMLRAQDSAAVQVDTTVHDASRYGWLAVGAVSAATWTQVLGIPEGWPRTWRGYGSRLGDQAGFAVAEEGLRAGLGVVIPWRGVVSACAGARPGRAVLARAASAARCGVHDTFVAHNAAGASRPNAPLLGAVVGASALSLAWRPERKSAAKGQSFVLTRIGIVLGATAFNKAWRAWRRPPG